VVVAGELSLSSCVLTLLLLDDHENFLSGGVTSSVVVCSVGVVVCAGGFTGVVKNEVIVG